MIVKTEAIEPIAGKATSTYVAIIIKINGSDKEDIKSITIKDNVPIEDYVTLQIYCPFVMSGDLNDARMCTTNYIQAPLVPHEGANKTYSYSIGGLISISYQNGNVNYPQFIKKITISEEAVTQNKKYIQDNVSIPAVVDKDQQDYKQDLSNTAVYDVIMNAVKNSNNDNITNFRVKNQGTYPLKTTCLFRLSKYSIEIATTIRENSYSNVIYSSWDKIYNSLKLYSTLQEQTWLYICQQLYKQDKSKKTYYILDIINYIIDNYYKDSIDYKYKKNDSNLLYWYSILSGCLFTTDAIKIDNSTNIENIYDIIDIPPSNTSLSKALYKPIPSGYDTHTSKYKGLYGDNYSIYFNHDIIDNFDDVSIETKEFLSILFNIIFDDNISSEYKNVKLAIAFFKNFIENSYRKQIKDNYNSLCTYFNLNANNNYDNIYLLVLVYLSVAFPVLKRKIYSFSSIYEENETANLANIVQTYVTVLLNNTSNSTMQQDIVKYYVDNLFFPLYLNELNIYDSQIKQYYTAIQITKLEEVFDKIKNQMILGINTIINDFKNIREYPYQMQNIRNIENNLLWPTNKIIITQYFKGDAHLGIDIGVPNNESGVYGAYAVADGKVIDVVNYFELNQTINDTTSMKSYGNYVLIEHDSGLKTRYAHLYNVQVSVGDIVNKGDLLAYVDNTGNSTGSHLHFETIENNIHVNPLNYYNITQIV